MEIKSGSVVLFHGKKFLPRSIQVAIKIKLLLSLRFKSAFKKVFNHAEIGLRDNQVAGAIEEGIEIRDFNVYSDDSYQLVRVYEYDWSEDQLSAIETVARMWDPKKYQFLNFGQWIVNIFSLGLIWPGNKFAKADNRFFCTEFVGTLLYYATAPNLARTKSDQEINKMLSKQYWKTSPDLLKRICDKHMKLACEYEIINEK